MKTDCTQISRLRYRHFLRLILFFSFSIAFFNGCSKVSFIEEPQPTLVVEAETEKEDNQPQQSSPSLPEPTFACSNVRINNPPLSTNRSVLFDNPAAALGNQACPFGQGDNDPPTEGFFSARVIQSTSVEIPSGTKLCNFNFSILANEFVYDDAFFLTINGHVVATNVNYFLPSMEKKNLPVSGVNVEVPVYDWLRIRGINRPRGNGAPGEYAFCLGMNEEMANCSWPFPAAVGTLQMNFSSELLTKFAELVGESKLDIRFITIGDNDAGEDCQHSPIEIKIDYSFGM